MKSTTVCRLIVRMFFLSLFSAATAAASPSQVDVYEGTVELPVYEFSGRELQPPLFEHSTVEGTYPYPQFLRPYRPGGPEKRSFRAVFVENEYLKMTVVPELGGRIYSLYDKVNGREVFYKNDVLKWSGANPRRAWLVGNIEITGPYDHHTLTINGEPFWFDRVIRHPDGGASVVLSSIDPFFRMKVNFVARLTPGLAAMEIGVFCYNPHDGRRPYMFWINAGVTVDRDTRFVYPMTRTIGHTTAEVAGWPYYNGVDFSWFKNNRHMLGVFGIDIYDNFLGAYDYGDDYGTFRWADRRVVQGMKTWTWGAGERAGHVAANYTDNAGPYIEIQSGRNVWDGHYEWLRPHTWEGWREWWFPVAGIGGMTTTTVDLSLNLQVEPDPGGRNSEVKIGLCVRREIPSARISVTAARGEILSVTADLSPARPFGKTVNNLRADSAGLSRMQVTVTDAAGDTVFSWNRPDLSPGGRDYTIFTEQLERPTRNPGEMTLEELVLDAETKIKEMHTQSAVSQLRRALETDPGYTRAHLNLGLVHYERGRPDSALAHLRQVLDRDPYNDEASYYTALSLFEQGDTARAERYLYYIARPDKYYSQREYLLGRLAWHRGEFETAAGHLRESVRANGYNLSARNLLAMVFTELGRGGDARRELEAVLEIDPTSRWAVAELSRLAGGDSLEARLAESLGGQAQEALELAAVYRALGLHERAIEVLRMVEDGRREVWGTPPVYYYTLASSCRALGRFSEAGEYFARGRTSGGNLDRFPFRRESLRPLNEAIAHDPSDPVARFQLGCLLYFLERREDAIFQWEQGLRSNPGDFSLQRSLGMAYYENGYGIEPAAEHLERAIELNPDHVRTFTDLGFLYSREGQFDRQLTLLRRALERAPGDDRIIEGLIATNLVAGELAAAESLFTSHKFEQRHRDYSLRDKFRWLQYGFAAREFERGGYDDALEHLRQAQFPPSNLGVDDFQFQSAPRLHYYRGLVLEAAGRDSEAREAFQQSSTGWDQLAVDRDSWNSRNYYMALSLEKLGETAGSERILASMKVFASSQLEYHRRDHRSDAHYLLALVHKREGNSAEAARLLREAVRIMPDNLGPRFELRRDVPDPLPE
ncbi:MAG: DUF5107 domain-containing protein [Candidatus Glassbacteria bacterium]|nr:DUF5107 domain-containing protein [Candidatus Glassbacteria bacterium]